MITSLLIFYNMKVLKVKTDTDLQLAIDDPALSGRLNIDGLPVRVTLENRQQFTNLYARNMLLITRKPYLDQLAVGLNHYGVCFYTAFFIFLA